MYDVNPLGPLMHLKEIERQALALRSTTGRSQPAIFGIASMWIFGLLKRLSVLPESKDLDPGSSMKLGRR